MTRSNITRAQILVTGASGGNQGSTGNRLTKSLLENGISVRALVHREDDRSKQLREIGADVFVGDLLDIGSMREAMRGIEGVFFCYQVRAGLLEATAIMAQTAKETNSKFILNLSQGAASDASPSPTTRRHWLSERIFDWSGTPVCHLRGGVFFENLFRQFAKGIDENSELRAPFGSGEGKVPAIAAEDISRVALVVMRNPGGFAGKTLQMFGPVLSLNEIAKVVSDSIGKPVRYREISPDEWIAEAKVREGEQNPDQIDHLVNLWKGLLLANQSESMAAMISGVSILYKNLTGEVPTSLDKWLRGESWQRVLSRGRGQK